MLLDKLINVIATPNKVSPGITAKENKKYYLEVENYDWVKATDNILGLETFFHSLRERNILGVIAKYSKKGKFLDAGCGTGLILRHLPKDSLGVDINPRNIIKANGHAMGRRVRVADLEKLDLKETFNNIICTEVIEHFLDPGVVTHNLYKSLRKGGILIGTVPGRSPLWRLRFLSSTRPREPYHYYFSRAEIGSLLEKAGFKIISLTHKIFAMEIVFVAEK